MSENLMRDFAKLVHLFASALETAADIYRDSKATIDEQN